MIVSTYSEYNNFYNELPTNIQGKVLNILNIIFLNETDLELIPLSNEKLYSIKIDDNYSMIVFKENDIIILLAVGITDNVIKWAEKKQIEINNGVLQLFEVPHQISSSSLTDKLFKDYSDEQLRKIGVPQSQLAFIRSFDDVNDYIDNYHIFSKDVYQNLEMLLEGVPYEQVLKIVIDNNHGWNFSGVKMALLNDVSKQSFHVVNNQKELFDIINEPLEKWRVFLHPQQRKLATDSFSGPVLVTGEAGTGKTVVAMHRTKTLLSKGKKVLFTTFTSNLVNDIKMNLNYILEDVTTKNLTVDNIDSIVARFIKEKSLYFSIVFDKKKLLEYWEKAISAANVDLEYDSNFYYQEWRSVCSILDKMDVIEYANAIRKGRGIRINKPTRHKVWQVFEEYLNLLKDDSIRDIDTAIYECRQILKKEKKQYYDSIVIDEAQDMSPNALKFLRLLAGEQHENDMFIVGDAHQRIYENKAIVNDCNIDVKGRVYSLKYNYRTTAETSKVGFGFLKNVKIDNLNDEYKLAHQDTIALTHGEYPAVRNFKDFNEQIKYILSELKSLAQLNVKPGDVCIVARNSKEISRISAELSNNKIDCYEIQANECDSNSKILKLATMHRVKGLEFKYVFVVSVNSNVIPSYIKTNDEIENENNDKIEKCLLYVSVTRAQKKAYVLSYGKPSILLNDYSNLEISKENSEELDLFVTGNYNKSNNDTSLDSITKKLQKSFYQQVKAYYYESNEKNVDIYQRGWLTKTTFDDIINKDGYKPKKEIVMQLCVGLKLDIEQSEKLLASAGYMFSDSCLFDLVVKYYISKKIYSMKNISDYIYDYNIEHKTKHYQPNIPAYSTPTKW